MSMTKTKSFLGSCCCLLLAFSVSANAAGFDEVDSSISIESWLLEGGRELPVLTFDEVSSHEEMVNDLRVENIAREADGTVRFQLSHSGPMSRQVFANVRRVAQDDGYTRSIITNIADGQQMEFLTKTSDVAPVDGKDKGGAAGLLAESGIVDGQYVECPWCVPVGLYILAETICVVQTNLFIYQCNATCESRGGVKALSTGVCGVAFAECVCWIQPRREAEEF